MNPVQSVGPMRKPVAVDSSGTEAALPDGHAGCPAPGSPSALPAAPARGPSAGPGTSPAFRCCRSGASLRSVRLTTRIEQEADRLAEHALADPAPDAAVAAGSAAGSAPAGIAAPAIAHDVLRQPGQKLDPADRAFFERRFGHDFGRVRVHADPLAAASAARLAARAWTAGDHIVFGAGGYRPAAPASRRLLAHELAHVVQQGGGRPTIRRSPLSDAVKAAWTADPSVDALLARLSQPDVQGAQSDADLDAELARLLAGRPDDLWVAQRVRQGRLGRTTGALGPPDRAGHPVPRPVEAFFFRGSTDRRALVIAGVHGSERQGIEVARMLISDLGAHQPLYTVIVVPSLFPDNAARKPFGERESDSTPTNRNFPPPTEDLAAATAAGHGTPVDASTDRRGRRTRAILPENLMLLELIERFHPERIISIHGTWRPGNAGVFYDPRAPRPDEVQAAQQWARGKTYIVEPSGDDDILTGQKVMQKLEDRAFGVRLAQLTGRDRDLSAEAATQIDTATASIHGRESRDTQREGEPAATAAANRRKRIAHPSVAGNVGRHGGIGNFTWPGSVPGGVSLGGYAPPRGISVFTVEPPIDAGSTDYPTTLDKVSAADRRIELQAYADAVRTVLLGQP